MSSETPTQHNLLPDESGRPRGQSYDGEFFGEPARFGTLHPGVQTDYQVRSPKVMKVLGGSVSFDGHTYSQGDIYSFPVGRSFELQTGPDEEFTYASRKADAATVMKECQDTLEKLATAGIGGNEWHELPRAEQYDRLEALIGRTSLEKIDIGQANPVVIKREFDNPSGSHYDRAYIYTLRQLEAIGFIQPGDELRDLSSGSAGISLALLGGLLGYKVRLTVPDELPANRLYPMLFFGAQLVSAGAGYIQAASGFQAAEIIGLKENASWQMSRPQDLKSRAFLFKKDGARICYLNHSENELSPLAFQAIGRELVEQQRGTVPDAVALAMGNWTSIAGISPVLRAAWPRTKLVGYEGTVTNAPHENYGTSVSGIPFRYKDPSLLDTMVAITDEERNRMSSVNANRKPVEWFGHSTLMGLEVARRLMASGEASNVTVIGYDQGIRYRR